MEGVLRGNARGLVLSVIVAAIGVGAALALTAGGTSSRLHPGSARAVFDAALVAQKHGRYHEAREGYLRALSLDPKMADARYQLALLTHEARADDEARHNLDELQAVAPNDPRLPGLRAALKEAPPAPAKTP